MLSGNPKRCLTSQQWKPMLPPASPPQWRLQALENGWPLLGCFSASRTGSVIQPDLPGVRSGWQFVVADAGSSLWQHTSQFTGNQRSEQLTSEGVEVRSIDASVLIARAEPFTAFWTKRFVDGN